MAITEIVNKKYHVPFWVWTGMIIWILLSFGWSNTNPSPVTILGEPIIISREFQCDYARDAKGYIGWPFVTLASLDDQSCGGNSAMIYERLYPLGVVVNAMVSISTIYGLQKLLSLRRE